MSYQHHMQNSLIEYYILYPEEHIKRSFKVNWGLQHTQFTRVELYFQRHIFNIISYSVHPGQISHNQLKQDLCYRYRNSALHRRQDGRNPHTPFNFGRCIDMLAFKQWKKSQASENLCFDSLIKLIWFSIKQLDKCQCRLSANSMPRFNFIQILKN